MTTLEQRVQNGMRYLDKHHPGWEREIDLYKLDMSNGCNCILGQIFGSYVNFIDSGRMESYDAEARGFTFRYDPDCVYEWSDLEAAWVSAIRQRRKQ